MNALKKAIEEAITLVVQGLGQDEQDKMEIHKKNFTKHVLKALDVKQAKPVMVDTLYKGHSYLFSAVYATDKGFVGITGTNKIGKAPVVTVNKVGFTSIKNKAINYAKAVTKANKQKGWNEYKTPEPKAKDADKEQK